MNAKKNAGDTKRIGKWEYVWCPKTAIFRMRFLNLVQ